MSCTGNNIDDNVNFLILKGETKQVFKKMKWIFRPLSFTSCASQGTHARESMTHFVRFHFAGNSNVYVCEQGCAEFRFRFRFMRNSALFLLPLPLPPKSHGIFIRKCEYFAPNFLIKICFCLTSWSEISPKFSIFKIIFQNFRLKFSPKGY